MTPPPIGTVLQRIREQKGLSQLALAKRAKITQGYISELEAGTKKNPGITTLRKLAKGLGVPPAELLG